MTIMEESHGLEPPERKDIADPGAHQLAEASDSEDQFMDAQSIPSSSTRGSLSIEENVDKEKAQSPSQDASGSVSGSGSDSEMRKSVNSDGEHEGVAVPQDFESNATTPKPDDAVPIPLTILEESSGEYPGQHSAEIQEHHKVDASPDVVLGADHEVKDSSRAQTSDVSGDASRDGDSIIEEAAPVTNVEDVPEDAAQNDPDDQFEDDFDDFEEGDGQDEDFDDFDDGFQEPETEAETRTPSAATQITHAMLPPQHSQLPFSIPDFDGLSPDEVISSIDPCISTLFPPEDRDFPIFPDLAKDSVFLTSRSASLWSQLVAPPPLAPPDWIRSHTRRLFLVSLGVPVDLDEILPASKQKKLILPSLNATSTSPRPSIDRRPSAITAKQGSSATAGAAGAASSSSYSAEEQAKGQSSSSRKRKGPPPEPELDLVAARHLCQTTDQALSGMTVQELEDHVAKLEAMQGVAQELLDYWIMRTDEKVGDKEAFEGVIENLVAHARKVRK